MAVDLPDIDPFYVYDAEIARLEAFFSSLGDDDWARPSRCEGWDTRDVLAHIMTVDMYNEACLDDDVQRMAGFDWDGYVEERRSDSVGQLLEEWRERNARVRSRWEERGVDDSVTTMVGQYPLRAQVFHIADEIGTHADDIFVPVEPSERRAREDWRAAYARFALDEYDRPVDVEILEDSVRVAPRWHEDEPVDMSKQQFIDACKDRLDPEGPLLLPERLMQDLRLIP